MQALITITIALVQVQNAGLGEANRDIVKLTRSHSDCLVRKPSNSLLEVSYAIPVAGSMNGGRVSLPPDIVLSVGRVVYWFGGREAGKAGPGRGFLDS
jgi:hypothetical protein